MAIDRHRNTGISHETVPASCTHILLVKFCVVIQNGDTFLEGARLQAHLLLNLNNTTFDGVEKPNIIGFDTVSVLIFIRV